MSIQSSKLARLYKYTLFKSYVFGFIGFMIGVKISDFIFYDPLKHDIERQQLQQQFWKVNGYPKHIKPMQVESVLNPGQIRKSWIQIIYGKDKIISKQQLQNY